MSDPNKINDFGALTRRLGGGRVAQDAIDMVRDIIAAIEDADANGGSKPVGELVLRIKFKKEGGVIDMASDLTCKKPKMVYTRTIGWATPDNHLTMSNPQQLELGIREVSGSPPPVRGLAG